MQSKLFLRFFCILHTLVFIFPAIAQDDADDGAFPAIVIDVSGSAFVQRADGPASLQEPITANTYIYPEDLIFIPQGQITILCPNSTLDALEIRSPGGAMQCEGGDGNLRPRNRNSELAIDTPIPYLIFPRNEYYVGSSASEINMLWAPVEGATRYTVNLEYRPQAGTGGWNELPPLEVTDNTLAFPPDVGEYRATILAFADSAFISTNNIPQTLEIDRIFTVMDSAMVDSSFTDGLERITQLVSDNPNQPPVLAWFYYRNNFSSNALQELQTVLPLDLRILSTKDTSGVTIADLTKQDLDQFEFLGRVLRDNNLRQEANIIFRLTHRIANGLELPFVAASALESLSTVANSPDETYCFLGAASVIYDSIDVAQKVTSLAQAQADLGIGVPECSAILADL